MPGRSDTAALMGFWDKKPAAGGAAVAGDAYERQRERAGRRQAAQSKSGRDIGDLPAVVDAKRRERCRKDLAVFLPTYFPAQFVLPFSRDHLAYIRKLQRIVQKGGLSADAMPRGTGKTTIAEGAALYAVLYWFRRFVFLIGADAGKASDLLDSLKIELETNDLLLADFPETCYPIRALEGIAQRAKGQLFEGKPTGMRWEADEITLPTIRGQGGAIIKTSGIEGGVRGAKSKRRDGSTARPDLCLVDDPQTDASARSDTQTAARLNVITGAVLGLAGPGKKIACSVPCTVIRPGDVADKLLDRKLNPAWQGTRTPLAYALPTDVELWDEYFSIRREDQRAEAGVDRCNAFYIANRAAMDAGADVAWPERFEEDEISAVQNVQNIRCDRGEDVFAAEYQNAPRIVQTAALPPLTEQQVAERINNRERYTVPEGCDTVTAFIDVQMRCLFYVVMAFRRDFTGYVLDYATWPKQRLQWFEKETLTDTFEMQFPGMSLEAQIYEALGACTGQILGREYKRDDGVALRVRRCLVDANWGEQTDTVYNFCRQSPHAALLMPSHGRGIGPDQTPMSRYRAKPNELVGAEWIISAGGRGLRYVTIDTNHWKTFADERLRGSIGTKGAYSLYGKSETEHRLFASHLCSEFATRTEGRGRVVNVWKQKPTRPDNDFWDGVVNCGVAASTLGITLAIGPPPPAPAKRKKRHVTYLE
jgi:hypothetical protein